MRSLKCSPYISCQPEEQTMPPYSLAEGICLSVYQQQYAEIALRVLTHEGGEKADTRKVLTSSSGSRRGSGRRVACTEDTALH